MSQQDKKALRTQLPKFQHHFNSEEFEPWYEVSSGLSTTVPNMTYSIKEIIDRFARNLPVTGAKVAIFEGEEDLMPDMQFMDKVDVEVARIEYVDELKAIQDRMQKRQENIKKAEEKRQNDAIKAAVEKAKQSQVVPAQDDVATS